MTKEELRPYIEKWSTKYDCPANIIYGVMKKESGLNHIVVRYENNYKWLYKPGEVKPATCSFDTEIVLQKVSYGLMQVMGAVFREYGFVGWLTELVNDVDRQVQYGVKHLSKKIKKYGLNGGISAYNAGIPSSTNQSYVNDVLKYSKEW